MGFRGHNTVTQVLNDYTLKTILSPVAMRVRDDFFKHADTVLDRLDAGDGDE